MSRLDRTPLRERVYEAILDRIVRGEHEDGITDSEVAEVLGVSRTPVREALLRLSREGIVDALPGRGFSLVPPSRQDAANAFPIMPALQALSIRTRGPFPDEVIAKLEELREAIGALSPSDPERIDRNLAWHRGVVAAAGNPHLDRMADGILPVLRRYGYAYLKDRGRSRISPALFEGVVEALDGGEGERAIRLLDEGWEQGRREMERWLASKPA